jgi:hypothetical protein
MVRPMIHINDRYWPLIVFRFSGQVSMEEMERYLTWQDAMVARNLPNASLVITENLRMWEMPVLRRQAEWIKKHEPLIRQYSIGAAMVITSPVVRGMLKALLWMQPMPQPHFVGGTTEVALSWLRECFRSQNVNWPSDVPSTLS